LPKLVPAVTLGGGSGTSFGASGGSRCSRLRTGLRGGGGRQCNLMPMRAAPPG